MAWRAALPPWLLALPLLLSCSGPDARSNEAGQRYANAHRKYADAACPIADDGIRHFIYFARDRAAIRGHPLLDHPRFVGAQLMYAWSELEPSKGRYDFSMIEQDLAYLASRNKRLFIQLQDATFSSAFRATPGYLDADLPGRGSVQQVSDGGVPEGWIARRWDSRVQRRFALLLQALGQAFDGRIEGINLQETAIGIGDDPEASFSPTAYVKGIKANMSALGAAFERSVTLQYANFMPGEWLPWDDKGYLRSIYRHGDRVGVGLGAPDLMVRRKGQLNHALAMMHEHEYTVPLGIAVQDGNYVGLTGADGSEAMADVGSRGARRENIVPLLHAFARDFLKVQYMFWVNQEPYVSEDVLPCFAGGLDGREADDP